MKPLGFSVEQMSDLLTAHDTLEDPDATETDRASAREQIATFADIATERCEELRKQLRHAEAFAEQLQQEKTRTRDTDVPSLSTPTGMSASLSSSPRSKLGGRLITPVALGTSGRCLQTSG